MVVYINCPKCDSRDISQAADGWRCSNCYQKWPESYFAIGGRYKPLARAAKQKPPSTSAAGKSSKASGAFAVGLAVVLLCGFYSSPSPPPSGGGSEGGFGGPPLPPFSPPLLLSEEELAVLSSSAMVHAPLVFQPSGTIPDRQVARDSPACDALQSQVLRHEADSHQDTTANALVLELVEQNQAKIRAWCSSRTERWFLQPYTRALNELGYYHKTISVLSGLGDPDALLSHRLAVALYETEAYERADSLFLRADSLYTLRLPAGDPLQPHIEQTLASMRVGHAWCLFRMGRHIEARRLLIKAEAVLLDMCCDAPVEEAMRQADLLRGEMAGLGLEPGKNRPKPPENGAMLWPGITLRATMAALGALLLFVVFHVGRKRGWLKKALRASSGPPPHR